MKITKSPTTANRWRVVSDSGETYGVALLARLNQMGSMYFKWSCTCPSRKQPCKHALAVEQALESVDEQAMERIE